LETKRLSSKFKGTPIKNVNGTGKDYAPFVGCDINEIIANLNRSVDSSTGTITSSVNLNHSRDSSSTDSLQLLQQQQQEPLQLPLTPPHPKIIMGTEEGQRELQIHKTKHSQSMHSNGNSHISDGNSIHSFKSSSIMSPSSVVHSLEQQQQQHLNTNSTIRSESSRTHHPVIEEEEDDNSTIATIATNVTLTSYQQQQQQQQQQQTRVRLFHTNENNDEQPKTKTKRKHTKNSSNPPTNATHTAAMTRTSSPPKSTSSLDQWESHWSSEHDCPYYYNKVTNAVTWDNPMRQHISKKAIVYEDEYVPIADYTNTNNTNDSTYTNNTKTPNKSNQQIKNQQQYQDEKEEEDATTTDSIHHTMQDQQHHQQDSNDTSSSSSLLMNNNNSNQKSSSITWERYWSDEHGCEYFHNPVTGEVQWDDPKINSDGSSVCSVRSSGEMTGRTGENVLNLNHEEKEEDNLENEPYLLLRGGGSSNIGRNRNAGGTNSMNDSKRREYEDDEVVPISDFTSITSTGAAAKSKSSSSDQELDHSKEGDSNNKMVGTSTDTTTNSSSSSSSSSSSIQTIEESHYEKKSLISAKKMKATILFLLQSIQHQNNNYDITSDRPITGADLAYQRKVNLLRKRKKKRIRRKVFRFIGFVSIMLLLVYRIVKFGMTPRIIIPGGQYDNANGTLGSISSSTPVVDRNAAVQDEVGTEVLNDMGLEEKEQSETNKISVSQRPELDELQKLSSSIEESLKMLHSSTSRGGGDDDDVALIGQKLDELKNMLERVQQEKDKQSADSNVEAIEQPDTNYRSIEKSSNEHITSDKMQTKNDVGVAPTKVSESVARVGVTVPYFQGSKKESKKQSKSTGKRNILAVKAPVGEKPTINKSALAIIHKSAGNEVQKVLSGAHYFGKFQNIIQSLNVALDVQLDGMNDNDISFVSQPDAQSSSSMELIHHNGTIRNQIATMLSTTTKKSLSTMQKVFAPIRHSSKQAVEQVSKHIKNTLPELHRSIQLGTKLSLQSAGNVANQVKRTVPNGAKIISKSSQVAFKSVKDAMEAVRNNELLMAAKHSVMITAHATGKEVARETIKYVKTLDYETMVKKGHISESMVFPDTRAMHCQMPFLKKVNKLCGAIRAHDVLQSAEKGRIDNDWIASSFISRKKGKIESSTMNGGWSVPIWKACDGSNCQSHHVVSSSPDFLTSNNSHESGSRTQQQRSQE
jgi:hypothetical protein